MMIKIICKELKLIKLFLLILLTSCGSQQIYQQVNIHYSDKKYESASKNQNELLSPQEYYLYFSSGFKGDTVDIFQNKKRIEKKLVLTSIKNLSSTRIKLKIEKKQDNDEIEIISKKKSIKFKLNPNYRLMYLHWLPNEKKWSLIYRTHNIITM